MKAFVEAFKKLGLPINVGKEVIQEFYGAVLGGELDGIRGTLRVGPDKGHGFVGKICALLAAGNLPALVWLLLLRRWISPAPLLYCRANLRFYCRNGFEGRGAGGVAQRRERRSASGRAVSPLSLHQPPSTVEAEHLHL